MTKRTRRAKLPEELWVIFASDARSLMALMTEVEAIGWKDLGLTRGPYRYTLAPEKRKALAPGHGFNSERSQRAENGGRP